jgi:hypothetical protein
VPEALDLAHVGEDLALREWVVLMAADVEECPEPGLAMNERDRSCVGLEAANLSELEVTGRAESHPHRISLHL